MSAREEARRVMMRGAMDDAVARWRRTGNDVYLWEGLRWALTADLPLPPECRNYLLVVAADIACLADLRDPRGDGAEGTPRPALSAERAVEVLPEVLGLSRRGYNALSKAARDRKRMHDAAGVEAAALAPRPIPNFRDRMRARGLAGEYQRNVRRRVAAGRQLNHPRET